MNGSEHLHSVLLHIRRHKSDRPLDQKIGNYDA